MTKFFTGKGDKGKSVFGKIKVAKSDVILGVIGELDELNAAVGFCRVEAEKENANWRKKIASSLLDIQETLFIIQAEIASTRFNFSFAKRISESQTTVLEKIIINIDNTIPQITKFIIPGGSELSARLDLSRTIARRVERSAVKFKDKINPFALKYLNRLSSALFAMSRSVNYKLKIREEGPSY